MTKLVAERTTVHTDELSKRLAGNKNRNVALFYQHRSDFKGPRTLRITTSGNSSYNQSIHIPVELLADMGLWLLELDEYLKGEGDSE